MCSTPRAWRIWTSCAEVSAPVNALVTERFASQSLDDLAATGVARLSLGSGLARLAHRAVLDLGTDMFGRGSFVRLRQGAPGAEIDALIDRGEPPPKPSPRPGAAKPAAAKRAPRKRKSPGTAQAGAPMQGPVQPGPLPNGAHSDGTG